MNNAFKTNITQKNHRELLIEQYEFQRKSFLVCKVCFLRCYFITNVFVVSFLSAVCYNVICKRKNTSYFQRQDIGIFNCCNCHINVHCVCYIFFKIKQMHFTHKFHCSQRVYVSWRTRN